MLTKIINSQAPTSTRVSSSPPKSSQKQLHEAVISPVKRHHDRSHQSCSGQLAKLHGSWISTHRIPSRIGTTNTSIILRMA
ncbi:hypothetical protein AB3S75_002480 [Citrus x aurantiifolia]